MSGSPPVTRIGHASSSRLEDRAEANDLSYTFLRASFFMQNLLTEHREDLARLLDREPRSIREFVRDNAPAFRPTREPIEAT
jgi:hypothetical protein